MLSVIKTTVLLFLCFILPMGLGVGMVGLFVHCKTNKQWLADGIMFGLSAAIIIALYCWVNYR